jgi:hypothetical protein
MMDSKHCSGCYCNAYNNGAGGATKCWNLKAAKLVMRKEVHVDQRPPWNQKARKLPSCYRRPRFVYVGPTRTN